MAYPTPPVLDPIQGTTTPNLTTGGPYDDVLNKIEAYFAQLGAYVDAQIAAVRGEIPSTTDFATTEQLEAVKQSASDAAGAAAAAEETAMSAQTAATAAQGAAYTAQSAADEASKSVATLGQTVRNITGSSFGLPTLIAENKRSVLTKSYRLYNSDGTLASGLTAIGNLFKSLMLLAPKGDMTALLGYRGDNTNPLTNNVGIWPSAALTAAYEAGGITKSSSDPVFTSADLATCKVSAEGVPYREE